MLQVVRHETLSGLRRGGTTLASADQLLAMAGGAVAPPPRDVADDVADNNLARMQRDGAALSAALDELITSRRAAARSR
jgi:hypothetical protein